MDTITHGIVGALIGKGFFSERNGRVATFAATVGAMFPDVDVVQEVFSSDPLAIVKYHRAITHSFVALPFFAALLAWLTRAGFAFAKKRQCDERVGDGAMIFDDRERVAREDFLDDINIREHRAYGGGKSCDAAVTLREKALADKRADNSVSYGVHERFEKVRVYTIARKSNDFEKR